MALTNGRKKKFFKTLAVCAAGAMISVFMTGSAMADKVAVPNTGDNPASEQESTAQQ